MSIRLDLSIYQKRLWLGWKINPHDPAYDTPLIFEIKGDLNIAALEKALHNYVNNYDEGWRTYFLEEDGKEQQIILDNVVVTLDFFDFSMPGMEDQIGELVVKATTKVFDLSKYPLYYFALIKTGENNYILVINSHHIISDAFTAKFLIEKIALEYNHLALGLPLEKFEKQSYADYICFEKIFYNKEKMAADLAYWKNFYTNKKLYLEFPFKRSAVLDEAATSVYFVLDTDISNRLKRLAREQRATLFIIIAAIYGILLSRYTAQQQFFITYPVDIRPPNFRNLPGFFVNHVTMAIALSQRMSFAELIANLTEQRRQVREHQNCPLTEIMRVLRQEGLVEGHNFFNVGIAETQLLSAPLAFKDLLVKSIRPSRNFIENELGLAYEVRKNGIEFRLDYRKAIFSSELINNFIFDFKSLLTQCCNDVNALVNAAPLLLEEKVHPPTHTYKQLDLSIYQKRFWLECKLVPDNPAHNTPLIFSVEGDLNIGALQKALNDFVNIYDEGCRTCFVEEQDIVQQIILGHSNVNLENIDLTNEIFEQELKVKEIVEKNILQPFNLAIGPLFRFVLIKKSAINYILILNFNHIISDAVTAAYFNYWVSASYNHYAFAEPLPDFKRQSIEDYIIYEQQSYAKDKRLMDLNYWQEFFRNKQLRLEFPFKRNFLAQNKAAASIYFELGQDLTAKLKQLMRQQKTTVFMIVAAIYGVLLARYTNQKQFFLNYPINIRPPQFKNLPGFLVNNVLMDISLNQDINFADLIANLTNQRRQTKAHQNCSLLEIVLMLRQEGSAEGNNFFNIGLAEGYLAPEPLKLKNLAIQVITPSRNFIENELGLMYQVTENDIKFRLDYSVAIFELELINNFVRHFKNLLKQCCADVTQFVYKVPMQLEEEWQKIIFAWNKTDISYPLDKTLAELFEDQVRKVPDAIAVIFERQSLTYQELNERANKLAHYLRDLGVKPDDIVAISLDRSLELIVGLLGILKAGAAYLPLDPSFPAARMQLILADAAPKLLLTQKKWNDKLQQTLAGSIKIIDLDSASQIEKYSTKNPEKINTSKDAVYVIYTSGSTGVPKGVINIHEGVVNRLFWMQQQYNLTEKDHVLQKTPFSFDVSVWELFWPLISGARLVIAPPETHKDPQAIAEIIKEQQITVIHFVPSMLSNFVEIVRAADCNSLRLTFASGEALSYDLQQNFLKKFSSELYNLYGPTEASIDVSFWRCEANIQRIVSIGKPIANTQLYILDDYLQPVPVGVRGELYIGGVGLARGYLNRPELTAEKFITKEKNLRLYRTGDLARYLPDGNIEYIGRLDDQVKIRGFRIELGEIEAALRENPTIQEAIVMAVGEEENKSLVAYIVNRADMIGAGTPTQRIEEIRKVLSAKLPDYMVPNLLVFLDKLPLTSNGKLDRKEIAKLEAQCHKGNGDYVAPRTEVEKKLVAIWAKTLDMAPDKISVHDDFFKLGGHSLLAVKLANLIRQKFDDSLLIKDIFASPTVAELAKIVARAKERININKDEVKSTRELINEVVLASDIQAAAQTYPESIKNIFLTGVTGFLGAFLLVDLLKAYPEVKIYCLVRAASENEALSRLKLTLKKYHLEIDTMIERIVAIPGDLELPLLGLDKEQFSTLTKIIDVIFHNGAAVNFTGSYEQLKAANIDGTQEILKLASMVKSKPIHYVSTVSVFPAFGKRFYEDDNLEAEAQLVGGYAQTKWVAEKMMLLARERGLNITIYRPGRITGHSQTGLTNLADFMSNFIKGCIQLGLVPKLGAGVLLDFTPVDYISQAIVVISQKPVFWNQNFHLIHPEPISFVDYVKFQQKQGYILRLLEEKFWLKSLSEAVYRGEANALAPFLGMLEFNVSHYLDKITQPVSTFDTRNTLLALNGTEVSCNPISNLFKVYLDYFIKIGFLSEPSMELVTS